VSMAMPPQPARKTPSGARRPKTLTEAGVSSESRKKVHFTTSHAQMMAATTPQAWIAMCAGVQKVSRPMDRCQETSQAPPMEDEVIARTPAQMYQGMAEGSARTAG
jgi:hypothetical protein